MSQEEKPRKGGKYGLSLDKIQLNLALILRASLPDLEGIVDMLEKQSGVFVVYKKVSANRFTVMEEQPY